MFASSVWASPQRWSKAAPATGIALMLLLSGCAATMSPQIYSPRLQDSKDAKSDPWARELPLVVAEVEQLQTRYITAVRELSQVQPAVTLSLIGLSAFSLLKGIISPSTDAIATAAVLGSAAYVYGSTVISKPRQLVYLAGVEALSCAVAAVEPYNKGADWLGDQRSPAAESFRGRIATAASSLDDLRRQAALAQVLNVTETIPAKPAAVLPNCAPKDRPSCDISSSATAEERRRFEASCKPAQAAFDRRCQPRQMNQTTKVAPDPMVDALLKQAADEQARLQRVLMAAQRTATAIEQAGPMLWERAVQIQVKVGTEVLKTEPDLSSVLAAVRGMGGAADLISGTDLFKPSTPTGPAASQGGEGSAISTRQLSTADRAQLDELRAAIAQAAQARVALALMVAGVEGRVAATRKSLALCEVKVPGVTLAVLPDDEEVRIVSGGSTTFYVSGGSGTPQGVAVAISGSVGELKRELDPSGRLRFTYTAPGSAVVDDMARIQFTDGSGQARHDVRVVVVAGESRKVTPLTDMTADDLAKFGLPPTATKEQKREAIERCQKKLALPVSGDFDARTQKEAQQGNCKPG